MGRSSRPAKAVPARRLITADVFCGAGGLAAGFAFARRDAELGYDIVYGVDDDRDCIATFRRNVLRGRPDEELEHRGALRSVRGLTGVEIRRAAKVRRIDVLIGGPNCQAVSSAGVRNPGDKRNDMFGEFVRLVRELRPRWFVMENVPGLTHRNNLPLLRSMLDRLARIEGYRVSADVLLASDYGVPQHRYRLFIVGTRTRRPILFPKPTHGSGRRRLRTVRDAIGSLAQVPTNGVLRDHERPEIDVLTEHRIRSIPAGGDWRDMPIERLPPRNFQTRASDQKGTYGRLAWDDPAFTITGLYPNVSAGPFVHPSRHRPLTAREAKLLQGFPKSFVFEGVAHSWARQIGNAVPPPLARALAEQILLVEAGERSGVAPRLTPAVVRAAAAGKRGFPVLTPRITAPRAFGSGAASPQRTPRPPLVLSRRGQRRLLVEAKMPAFTWTGKRARAVLWHRRRVTYRDIAQHLGLSVETIRRWVHGYRQRGADGWRAYHTSVDAIAGNDRRLRRRLREAVRRARGAHFAKTTTHRPHMNRYVRHLARKFGKSSVRALIRRLAVERDVNVGTVYVADLLAIADVLLSSTKSRRPAA